VGIRRRNRGRSQGDAARPRSAGEIRGGESVSAAFAVQRRVLNDPADHALQRPCTSVHTAGQHGKRPETHERHPGHRRPTPTRIDERKEHRLSACPCCGEPLQRGNRSRTWII